MAEEEAQLIDIGTTSASQMEPSPEGARPARGKIVPVVIIGAVVVMAVLIWSMITRSDLERADAPPSSTQVPTLNQPEKSSTDSNRSSAVASATATTMRDQAVDSLGDGQHENLVVLRDGQISIITLSTGTEVQFALDAPARAVGLASADGRLAFVGASNAFLSSLDGSSLINLGEADIVVDGSTQSVLWVGQHLEDSRTNWREINSDGERLRTTITERPTEFNQPDLRWGHQHRFLRLTDSPTRPWRLIAQGSPIAIGPNDLILSSCDAEGQCGRLWLDPQTGADRGLLLSDIAKSLGPTTGGIISPGGRYLLRSDQEDHTVILLALSSGIEVVTRCTDTATASWSSGDSLLACRSGENVLIHDPESGAQMTVNGHGAADLAFVFVSA